MFCRKCGQPVNDNARFCGQCGFPTTNPDEAASPADASQDIFAAEDDEITIEQEPVPEPFFENDEMTIAQLSHSQEHEPLPSLVENDEAMQDPFLSLDAQFFDSNAESTTARPPAAEAAPGIGVEDSFVESDADDDGLGDISDPVAAFEMALAHATESARDDLEDPSITMEASFFQPKEDKPDATSSESSPEASSSKEKPADDASFEAEFFKVESSPSTTDGQSQQSSLSGMAPERDFKATSISLQPQPYVPQPQPQPSGAPSYGNAQAGVQPQPHVQPTPPIPMPSVTPNQYEASEQPSDDYSYDMGADQNGQVDHQQGSGGKVIAIILIVVAVAAAVAIGIFAFMYFNPASPDSSGSSTSSSTSSTSSSTLDTEKSGDLASFMIGEWDCADAPTPCVYAFTEDTATIKKPTDEVITEGSYYLKDDQLGIYSNGSSNKTASYTAVLDKEDENTVSLTDKNGTVSLRRIDTNPDSNSEQELMKKLVGYWEGIDNEGQVPITQEFLVDGTCIIGYHGVENADSGRYWVEGDVLYIQGHLVEEPYNYRIAFLNDGQTLIETNVDSQATVHLDRAVKAS